MGKRRKHDFKKKDIISNRRRRSCSESVKKLAQIPDDLIFEILSKLPSKSIARFRCLSKLWNSNLRSSEFTNLFLKVSSSRPRLLFTVKVKDQWHFYSAPQLLNPDDNSSPLTVVYHMSFPMSQSSANIQAPINGLVFTKRNFKRHGCKDSKVMMISNPSTGQSIPLPMTKSRPREHAISYYGYDPINNQYKVLYMSIRRNRIIEHEVLTLGIKEPAWRMIECSLPRHYPYSPICINGILYYLGIHGTHGEKTMIVCFDVSSEKFQSIEAKDNVQGYSSRLLNYKGKLGVLRHDGLCFFTGETIRLELLVLDDVEKNEWSEQIFVLHLWKEFAVDIELDIVGMTRNGELVFSPLVVEDPLYLIFYNLEKNTIAKVRIQGMETVESQNIHTFIDYVENVKLM